MIKQLFLVIVTLSFLAFGSASFAANTDTTHHATVTAEKGSTHHSSTKTKKVNINKASAKQLQSLHGIGEKKAKAIVDYRKVHGKFKNAKDLTKVKGIDEKTYKKLSKEITVK